MVSKNADQETVVKYVSHLDQIDPKLTANQEVMVRPVLMSDYKQIVAEANRTYRKFKDSSFPANSHSLGDIGVANVIWKRITDFINYPTLFDHNIGPYDVVHRNVGDCYLLSAIAALAENADLIKQIFYGQSYS